MLRASKGSACRRRMPTREMVNMKTAGQLLLLGLGMALLTTAVVVIARPTEVLAVADR